jgi:hypothetical protein
MPADYPDDLFSWAERAARRSDPHTSHKAARRTPSLRARDRRRVLLTHALNPHGLTDFELADRVGRQQTSAGKRRGELRDFGYIEETDRTRPAPSGASAIVWRVTPAGIAVAAIYAPFEDLSSPPTKKKRSPAQTAT